MRQQKYTQHSRMLAAAATVLAAGFLGAAVTGCADSIDTSPATLTTEEEGTDTPEDPSGLQQTNSFGYIPEHETTLETDPIEPEGGNIEDDPFELGGGAIVVPGVAIHPPGEPTLTTPAG
ncbi:Secreted protein [Prescottella defluvii]|uniref:hypothetical protein n=1 Tax=Prescottella defluvii TaxID=1323361 RepID=UPI0004F2A27B|nr:hypothetical protein [Prescottella defluvii]